MAKQGPKDGGPSLLSDPRAPDVYADEAVGMTWLGNVLRITLVSWRWDWTNPPAVAQRVEIGRLAIPIEGARALHQLLGSTLAKIDAQGAAGGDPGSQTMQ